MRNESRLNCFWSYIETTVFFLLLIMCLSLQIHSWMMFCSPTQCSCQLVIYVKLCWGNILEHRSFHRNIIAKIHTLQPFFVNTTGRIRCFIQNRDCSIVSKATLLHFTQLCSSNSLSLSLKSTSHPHWLYSCFMLPAFDVGKYTVSHSPSVLKP